MTDDAERDYHASIPLRTYDGIRRCKNTINQHPIRGKFFFNSSAVIDQAARPDTLELPARRPTDSTVRLTLTHWLTWFHS